MNVNYYSQASLWREDVIAPFGHVTDAILAMIPDEAKSILDAGCGNGAVTNFIARDRFVIGCDISVPALKAVKRPSCASTLDALPFADATFDLVIVTDVLEHIPDASYAQALSELARVSRRWILVAVPYKEQLDNATIDCRNCGTSYHVHWHQRSYSAQFMADHWRGVAGPAALKFAGARWIWSDQSLLSIRRATVGRYYAFEEAVCPKCGVHHEPGKLTEEQVRAERWFEALHYSLAEAGEISWPSPSEILVLYDKHAPGSETLPEITEAPPDLPSTIVLSQLARNDNPVNYPRAPYLTGVEEAKFTLTLPRLPRRITFRDPTPVSIFDNTLGSYLDLSAQGGQTSYEIPDVAPGRSGYLIQVRAAADAIGEIALSGVASTACDVAGGGSVQRALGLARRDLSDAVQKLEQLNQLSNDIETARSAGELKVQELMQQVREIEERRSVAEAEVQRLSVQLDNLMNRPDDETIETLVGQPAMQKPKSFLRSALQFIFGHK